MAQIEEGVLFGEVRRAVVCRGSTLGDRGMGAELCPGPKDHSESSCLALLPGLPLEYWEPTMILAVAAETGRPLSVDEFTYHLKKMGYAHVKVEIDAGKPLKPGVLIHGKKGHFWQQFVYENLRGVCFRCGRKGHIDDGRRFSEGVVPAGSGDLPVCSIWRLLYKERGVLNPHRP